MKKQNRIIAIFITAIMFFSLYTQPTVAAEASAAAFGVESFEYCDGNGNPISLLPAGGTLTANAKIRRLSGDEDASLMLMAYKKGKIIALSTDKADFSGDNLDDVSAQISMPADVSGVKVYAYIWNSAIGMKAISASAVFGSTNANVISATIGKNLKAEFDSDGNATVTFPASFGKKPAVAAVCEDLTTAVTPTYGDGVITLTAKAHSGAEKTYKINYTATDGALSNVSYKYGTTEYSGDTYIKFATVRKSLNPEDFYNSETNGYTKSIKDVYNVTPSNGYEKYVTPNVSTRFPQWHMMEVPDRFVGLNCVALPYAGATNGTGEGTLTFTTNKSVRVYVSSDASWTDDGATDLGSFDFRSVCPDANVAATKTYAELLGMSRKFTGHMYSYDIKVEEGGDSVTETVKLKALGVYAFPYFYYEFIDNSEITTPPAGGETGGETGGTTPGEPDTPVTPDTPDEPPVTAEVVKDVVYTYGTSDTSDKINLTQTGVLRKPDEKITGKAGQAVTLSAALDGTDKANVKNYASLAYVDRNCSVYYNIPDVLVGKKYYPMKYYKTGGGYYSGGNYVLLDFTATADVQIWFMGMSWKDRNKVTYLGEDGVFGTDDDVAVSTSIVSPDSTDIITTLHIDDGKYNTDTLDCITNKTPPYREQKNQRLWTATITLPDGVTSAKYRIEGAVGDYLPFTFAFGEVK